MMSSHGKAREDVNPIFRDRKLKLGTFQTNLDYGCVMSDIEGRLEIGWETTSALARLADEMDFEAIVPVARWRGFGGRLNPQGPGFETYTWAAGIAAQTRRSGVAATSHVSLNHPITAAKQIAAIDHISGGRSILNVVTGWNRPEIEMFGATMLDHDVRYDCAEEWLGIVKRLWTEDDEFDHDGRFYHIRKGYLQPKPLQSPYPALMNAGGSDKGRDFASRYCDVVFTVLKSGDPEVNRAQVQDYKTYARERYGRRIQVWTNAYCVQAETEAEAKKYHDFVVHERGDWEAAETVASTMGLNAQTMPPDVMQRMKGQFIAGWGGAPLIGAKEQIVDGLAQLAATGLDGLLLSWPRYQAGMTEFRDITLPLLKQAGLR
jgi:FMNH2-dependent dimethyl sulfone monooxygenase